MNENELQVERCPVSNQTRLEEVANVITHGIGFALSIAGFIALVVVSFWNFRPLLFAGSIVYGISLMLLYCMSTLYHFVRSPKVKRVMRILDHSSIYLLIAGTYTPYAFGALKGVWGWSVFSVIWTLAISGVIIKSFRLKKKSMLSTIFYLAMGWLCMFAIVPLFKNLSTAQFAWLLGGGAFYSIGTIFFSLDRMPFSHAIWHLFVLGGSICHYASIFSAVAYPFVS
ncbi:MAG: hemolysin III family protein [Rhabdochlamydiaceae bacterium]|nr:hemolysin III family protein [Candidatus Amphrikana amoebophyrae]